MKALPRNVKHWASWLLGVFLLLCVERSQALSRDFFDTFLDRTGLEDLFHSSSFDQFVRDFWPIAKQHGITPQIYQSAFYRLTPDPSILDLAENQAEFKKTFEAYIKQRLTSQRIAEGVKMAHLYAGILSQIEHRFGVNRYILLAIWGLESHYGATQGNKDIIRSLATLAYRGKRQGFARKQLISALKILQNGDVSRRDFKGSWAGAMGHTQFIPTTYEAYAVDWTRDGKRDIWNSAPDALASTANYLAQSGWVPGGFSASEVQITRRIAPSLLSGQKALSLWDWNKNGVFFFTPNAFVTPQTPATLLFPDNTSGSAFLVGENFKAILAYNKSNAYALSVSLLAEAIASHMR